jgi:(p)ppGpp synthase/HD superfamily hydrolase
MPNSSIVEAAKKLAYQAHQNQTRKGGAPYITHPERVAGILAGRGFDDLTVAAGWLHDVLEDTDTPESEILKINAELPAILKDVTENSLLPWAERKKDFTDNLRNASGRAKAVACADRIDNLTSFLNTFKTVGADFWKKWPERTPQEKLESDRYFLAMLKTSWEDELIPTLERLVNDESEIVGL